MMCIISLLSHILSLPSSGIFPLILIASFWWHKLSTCSVFVTQARNRPQDPNSENEKDPSTSREIT